MRFLRHIFIMQALVGIACTLHAQPLQPLHRFLEFSVLTSTKSDVEKIYGKGESKSNPYFVTYVASNLRVSVEFAVGDCKSKAPLWNVPEWTIAEITYSFLGERPRLKTLLAGQGSFRARNSGDVLNHVEYYDDVKGISILYDKKGEGVMDVIIRPSAKAIKKFECSGRP